jgi:aminoglycoside phosphotransferase (APT) family kinase protein
MIGRDRNRRIFQELVRAAGPALASIHVCDIPFGTVRTLNDQVGRLRDGLEDFSLTAPGLHRTMRDLIPRIEARAEGSEAIPVVPTHGDFKWDQFLHDRGRFGLIDFEFFCLAEPAYDLGYFCGYLPPSNPEDWRESAAAEMLRREFLQAYEDAIGSPVDISRVAAHEAAVLGIRAMSYAWQHFEGWEIRASALLDLAFERLANPLPEIPD